jgi:hypothetical protein
LAKPKDKFFYKKSVKRSGPLGLIDYFDCDFFIVKTEADEECNLRREKATKLGQFSEEKWLNLPHELTFGGNTQAQCAVKCNNIPYEEYDIVIFFHFAVPHRLVRQYSKQLWCYYVSEPPLEAWKQSWSMPMFGYDIFFSQLFRDQLQLMKQSQHILKDHIIDMPYVACGQTTYASLFDFEGKNRPPNAKPIAILPKYSQTLLDPEGYKKLSDVVDIKIAEGSIVNYLSALHQADYHVRLGTKSKFGNESIEAVATGCLFVSSTRGWKNRVFNVTNTAINSLDIDTQLDDLITLIGNHEKNENLRVAAKNLQAQILDRVCYKSNYAIARKVKSKRIVSSNILIGNACNQFSFHNEWVEIPNERRRLL